MPKVSTKAMPKASAKLYENTVSLRRSKRYGLRRSHRRTHKVKRNRKTDSRKTVYDRDMGGYKWGSDKWRRTKREKKQVKEERDLVRRLRTGAKKMTESGYSESDFVVGDDEEVSENTFEFDTDNILDKADAQEAEFGWESDSDWGPDSDYEASSDDSDVPEGSI